MKVTVQVVVHDSDESDTPTVLREVLVLDRDGLGIDTVGLQLDEAKELLAGVQDIVVDAQVAVAVAAQVGCPHCGAARRHKDTGQVVVRSLFGTLRVPSPRWWHCGCQPHPTRTFRPVAELLPERTTPELAYLQARFAAQASYQVAATLLAEVLPLGRTLHAATVRRHTHAVAQRLEGELGDEQPSFISGCPRDWQQLPRPDLPLIVGLDGGYVHAATQRSRRDGWFEVIAGKAMQANGNPTCFGFVQTYDTKPKRRLFEVLTAHGMAPNQQVTFLTDGGEDIRDLPRMLNPQAEHLLDWFHITMRITVMTNMAKSLCSPPPDPDLPAAPPPDLAADVGGQLESVKWFLWHGNVFRALQIIDELTVDLDVAEPSVSEAKLLKAVGEFDSYIRPRQRRADPQLRRALPGRRDHLDLVRRVRGQPAGQQAHGQEAADALDPARRAPPVAGPCPGPQRPARRRLPPVAPSVHQNARPPCRGRVAPPACPALVLHVVAGTLGDRKLLWWPTEALIEAGRVVVYPWLMDEAVLQGETAVGARWW